MDELLQDNDDEKFVKFEDDGHYSVNGPDDGTNYNEQDCNPYFEECVDECVPGVDVGCYCEAGICLFLRGYERSIRDQQQFGKPQSQPQLATAYPT